MKDLEIITKFVNGDISIAEFMSAFESQESLRSLLQSKMPASFLKKGNIMRNNNSIIDCFRSLHWRTIYGAFAIHSILKDWLTENKFICNPSDEYKKAYEFSLDVTPDYINGEQAGMLISEIIQSVPESLPKTKRIKEIKEKIKVAFHLLDGKRPQWAQDTDWPFSKNGKPMKYISRKQEKDSELVELIFEDVDTGAQVIVEDLY